jgi:hypothetical protein
VSNHVEVQHLATAEGHQGCARVVGRAPESVPGERPEDAGNGPPFGEIGTEGAIYTTGDGTGSLVAERLDEGACQVTEIIRVNE